MTKVTDYDLFGYDYTNYWKDRRYENESEKMLLSKIFRNKNGNWFLDIGGSYGRLTSTYYSKYTNPVILDYSLQTLTKNKDILKTKYPNIQLIAANAYKLPFKDNSFDGALMVRVLHHIEKPSTYFKELFRTITKIPFTYRNLQTRYILFQALKLLLNLTSNSFQKNHTNNQQEVISKEQKLGKSQYFSTTIQVMSKNCLLKTALL